MSVSKKLNIRPLNIGEEYAPAFAGMYRKSDGTGYYLTNPKADTLWIMKDLPTAERQFKFHCFVSLEEIASSKNASKIWGNDILQAKFDEMRKEFEKELGEYRPWNANARFLTTHSKILFPDDILKGDKIDFELLEDDFNDLTEYEFILYP